jgi:hypothetical protein
LLIYHDELARFAGLLFHERRVKWHLLAYGGSALAVATKGLSGLLPVLYAVLFCLAMRPAGKRLRDLFHPMITPAAAVLASAWYAWAFFEHGQSAATDFFGDQVGNRLSGSKGYIISNALVYLSSFVVQLLPWSLLAVLCYAADRRAFNLAVSNDRRVVQFAIGWILLLFLVFTPGNIQRTRYFLPAYSMLALVFAFALLPQEVSSRARTICEAGLRWFLWAAGFAGLALALLGFMLSPVLVLSGVVLAVAAWIVLRLGRGLPWPQRFALAAGYILLWFSVNLNFMAPTFLFSPAPEITRRATELRPSLGHSRLPMTGMDSAYPSQVRALSGGKVQAYVVPADQAEQALKKNGVLVCTEPVLARWKPERATVEPCGVGSIPWKSRDYVALLRTNDRPAFVASKRLKCYLVSRSAGGVEGLPASTPNIAPAE